MMDNLLEYKGYHSKIEFDAEDLILHGKIEGINDLVTFESDSAEKIVDEFHAAVDDYLDYCSRMGKQPDKEFKGSFNVRVSAQVHKAAFYKAMKHNMTLNAYVAKTLENDLFGNPSNVVDTSLLSPYGMNNYSKGEDLQTNTINYSQYVMTAWN